MQVQIIYNSLSGCTRKLAEGIYEKLEAQDKRIDDLKNGVPQVTGDIVLLGYWVDKGGPNAEMKEFMEKLEGKKVGVFCTLAFWCDAQHGAQSLSNGAACVSGKNTVIGGFVANGHMSQQMIDAFRANKSGHHAATPASEIRWDLMKEHPTQAEIALAAERFNERIRFAEKLAEAGLDFQPITL